MITFTATASSKTQLPTVKLSIFSSDTQISKAKIVKGESQDVIYDTETAFYSNIEFDYSVRQGGIYEYTLIAFDNNNNPIEPITISVQMDDTYGWIYDISGENGFYFDKIDKSGLIEISEKSYSSISNAIFLNDRKTPIVNINKKREVPTQDITIRTTSASQYNIMQNIINTSNSQIVINIPVDWNRKLDNIQFIYADITETQIKPEYEIVEWTLSDCRQTDLTYTGTLISNWNYNIILQQFNSYLSVKNTFSNYENLLTNTPENIGA
jgi:hypothetical protein